MRALSLINACTSSNHDFMGSISRPNKKQKRPNKKKTKSETLLYTCPTSLSLSISYLNVRVVDIAFPNIGNTSGAVRARGPDKEGEEEA